MKKYNIKITIIIVFFFFNFQLSIKGMNMQVEEHFSVTGDTVKVIGNNIMVIFQDAKNQYWFGSWEEGLYMYNGNTILHFTTKHGLPSNRIEEIKTTVEGALLVNTDSGLTKFNGSTFEIIPETIGTFHYWRLTEDDVWFKNPKPAKVWRYDGKMLYSLDLPKTAIGEAFIRKYPTYPNPYAVYCNYRDSKGNVWFGTATLGALRFNGNAFTWISTPDVTELHNGPANGVRAIVEDNDHCFWFNTLFKYKMNEPSVKTSNKDAPVTSFDRIKNIGSLDGKKYGNINEYLSIIKDNEGALWVAFYKHGVWKIEGTKVQHYPVAINGKTISVFSLYKDNKGNIWLGTHENGAYLFQNKRFEPFRPHS